MKVVSQDGEPIDNTLHLQRGHILEVHALSRKNNRNDEILSQIFTQLVNQVDLVLSIGWFTTAIRRTRPLPMDLNTSEFPSVEKLFERIDESLAVGFGTRHVRPGSARRSLVGHFPAADRL